MRHILFILVLISSIGMQAQDVNPFLSQGQINPSPLYSVGSDGNGTISFLIGNGGDNALELVKEQELQVTIHLQKVVPDHANPLASISGNYADYFSWNYNRESNAYRGVQKKAIPAAMEGGVGEIRITFKVNENSNGVGPQCGIRANLIVPGPWQTHNLNVDDQLDVFTWTVMRPLPQPDFEVTKINKLLSGDVHQNDKAETGTTYGLVVPHKDNPSSCMVEVADDGTYVFACPIAGLYVYDVELCEPSPSTRCMKVPLTIKVLASEESTSD